MGRLRRIGLDLADVALGILLIVLWPALRVASLIRPTPLPPWLTPTLEGPFRRLTFDRDVCLQRSGITAGSKMLEIGPGGGYVTERALDCTGPAGWVVCLDLQVQMLGKVRARTAPRSPALVCASGSQLPIRDAVFDNVIVASVLGEIPDKQGALHEFARVLLPGGIVAVTESLPDPDYVRTTVLRRRAAGAGLTRGERIGRFSNYTHRFLRP